MKSCPHCRGNSLYEVVESSLPSSTERQDLHEEFTLNHGWKCYDCGYWMPVFETPPKHTLQRGRLFDTNAQHYIIREAVEKKFLEIITDIKCRLTWEFVKAKYNIPSSVTGMKKHVMALAAEKGIEMPRQRAGRRAAA